MVEVAALPHVAAAELPAMLVPSTTALVVVDVQTDFAAPAGLLGAAGVDLSAIEPALGRIEQLIASARAAGVTVAFMRVMTTVETDSHALKTLYARRGMPGGEAICRAGGDGAEYYRVHPRAGDIEIQKRLFNSFHGTDLDAQLRDRGIETLVMTGFTTECCVDQTARGAFHRDYHVFVVSDACAAYDPDLHLGALRALQSTCALLVTSETVETAWA